MSGFRVALLGAESTGKTRLAQALAAPGAGHGWPVTVLPEVLRGWCERTGRTPQQHEQRAIAQAQADLLLAAPTEGLVLADATPLMVAVYSDLIFGDRSLYPMALDHHRQHDLTLLMGLDLPWVADPLRDGPQVRAPVDARLRALLGEHGIAYATVYGQGEARTRQALTAIARAWQRRDHPEERDAAAPVWVCGECSDPDCEHRLFTQLLRQRRG